MKKKKNNNNNISRRFQLSIMNEIRTERGPTRRKISLIIFRLDLYIVISSFPTRRFYKHLYFIFIINSMQHHRCDDICNNLRNFTFICILRDRRLFYYHHVSPFSFEWKHRESGNETKSIISQHRHLLLLIFLLVKEK